jgi:hypothetical protein
LGGENPLRCQDCFVYDLFIWCPEGDLNPHDLAVCGF